MKFYIVMTVGQNGFPEIVAIRTVQPYRKEIEPWLQRGQKTTVCAMTIEGVMTNARHYPTIENLSISLPSKNKP